MNIPKNTKTILYAALAILIVAGLGYAVYSKQQSKNDVLNLTPTEIAQLNEKERKAALEAQLKDLEKRATELPADADRGDKFTVYIQLAEVRNSLGMYDEALAALDQIKEERANNTRVLATYASVFKNKGDIVQAKDRIIKALVIDDELPQSWVMYLELHNDLPNDQLEAKYREAIAKTKSNVDVMVSFAKFAEKIGNKDLAVAAWETAINGDPSNETKYREEIARLRK